MDLVTGATAKTAGRDHVQIVTEKMRVLIVAGIPAGALLVGFGSRVAMFILRVTSPGNVHGVKSDDGFIIGQVTLKGTYNLVGLGAVVGIIGAAAYMFVSPWLIGPLWFRRLTTGLAAAVVVGSMLIHADGIDFNLLKPTWLAIALFVALPGLFGTFIGTFVDAVRRPDSWTVRGRRRWTLAVLCVACVPVTLLPLAFAFIVVLLWHVVIEVGLVRMLRRIPGYALVVRSVWMLIAVAGLLALLSDIDAIMSVN